MQLCGSIPEQVAVSFSSGPPDPGVKPTSPVSPALQVHSLPAEPLGKHTCGDDYGLNKKKKSYLPNNTLKNLIYRKYSLL